MPSAYWDLNSGNQWNPLCRSHQAKFAKGRAQQRDKQNHWQGWERDKRASGGLQGGCWGGGVVLSPVQWSAFGAHQRSWPRGLHYLTRLLLSSARMGRCPEEIKILVDIHKGKGPPDSMVRGLKRLQGRPLSLSAGCIYWGLREEAFLEGSWTLLCNINSPQLLTIIGLIKCWNFVLDSMLNLLISVVYFLIYMYMYYLCFTSLIYNLFYYREIALYLMSISCHLTEENIVVVCSFTTLGCNPLMEAWCINASYSFLEMMHQRRTMQRLLITHWHWIAAKFQLVGSLSTIIWSSWRAIRQGCILASWLSQSSSIWSNTLSLKG